MAKTVTVGLTGEDLIPAKIRHQSASRQRGTTPSSDLVPLQFRMTPEFVKAFKQAALDRDMKLNELLNEAFNEFMKK